MRLTFRFGSDTNENWFRSFMLEEYPMLEENLRRVGPSLVLYGVYVSDQDIERIEDEAHVLGATITRSPD